MKDDYGRNPIMKTRDNKLCGCRDFFLMYGWTSVPIDNDDINIQSTD